MYRFFTLFIMVVSLTCMQAQDMDYASQNETLLEQLDKVVANKELRHKARLYRADSLRSVARDLSGGERISIYKEAYDSYSRFLTDSVFSLLNEIRHTPEYADDSKLQAWTGICEARNYGVMGLYSTSFDILRDYRPEGFDPETKLLYYNTIHAVTGWMADYSRMPASNLSVNLADSAMSYLETVYSLEHDTISSILVYSTLMLDQGNYQHCIDTLLSSKDLFDEGASVYLYAVLAQAYEKIGQEDAAIYYLTKTCINDLEEGVTEYMALPILAKRMQEKGQTERAYRYLICSLEDASLCHSSLRTFETANFFPIIDGARRAEEKRLQQSRQFATVLGVLCVFFIIYFLVLRIKTAQREVSQKKKYLEEISFIAEHDELTGLLNRHGCNLYIAKAITQKQPGYLGILDIDLFKKVNDTYGHNVGDKVLKAVADCFKAMPHNTTARIGGDEFITFTTDSVSPVEYLKDINQFFDAIRAIELPEMKGQHISVSYGAVYFDGISYSSFDELYREADRKLYQSKMVEGCKITL